MAQTLVIDRRFCGPPDSGNGGYSAGLLAAHVAGEGAVEVTLRAPPPLDRPLNVRHTDEGVLLLDGETPVASAKAAPLDLEAPPCPPLDTAKDAVTRYPGFEAHIFPACFVCGPHREEGDGLRLFTGPVDENPGEGGTLVAAPWVPHGNFADANGSVAPEILWSALDCPGAFSFLYTDIWMVLGRITAEIYALPEPGDACIVAGWPLGRDGRKSFSGTAVYGPGGEVLAKAKSVWIEIAKRED